VRLKAGASTFTVCGTADYVAPELLSGRGHGAAVDWWSLGCVLGEMLSGRPPFGYAAEDHLATSWQIACGDFSLPADVSPPLADAVRGLLQVDAQKRLGAAGALGHACLAGLDVAAVRAGDASAAPWRPGVSHDAVVHNFDVYDDGEESDVDEFTGGGDFDFFDGA